MAFSLLDDRAELEAELSYVEPEDVLGRRAKRGWYHRPMGVNAISVLAGALWLVFMGITVQIVGRATDLGAVFLLVVIFAEFFVAYTMSTAAWRAIGPVGRGVFRTLARLGPLLIPVGLMAMLLLAAPFLAANERARLRAEGVTDAQIEHGVRGAVVGKNWRILLDAHEGYREDTVAGAQAACKALGTYRLPRADEVNWLEPTPRAPDKQTFWVEPKDAADKTGLVISDARKEKASVGLVTWWPGAREDEVRPRGILCVNDVAIRIPTGTAGATAAAPAAPAAPVVEKLGPAALVDHAKQWPDKQVETVRDALGRDETVAAAWTAYTLARTACAQGAQRVVRSDVHTPDPRRSEQAATFVRCVAAYAALEPAVDASVRAHPAAVDEALRSTDVDTRAGAVAVAWRAQEPAPALAQLLSHLQAAEPAEAAAAEAGLYAWARRYPDQARALKPAAHPALASLRAQHALAAAVGWLPGCTALGWRASPLDRSGGAQSADALRDLNGPCARAAAESLARHFVPHRGDIAEPSAARLEALGNLGVAASPALNGIFAALKKPVSLAWRDEETIRRALGDAFHQVALSEYTRRAGASARVVADPRISQALGVVDVEKTPCTPRALGIAPATRVTTDGLVCVAAAVQTPVVDALRASFVPLTL